MALAAELYDDPRVVLERQETGDSVPASTRLDRGTCLNCRHCRSSLLGWPCRRNNMPSARTGRCRVWSG